MLAFYLAQALALQYRGMNQVFGAPYDKIRLY